MDKRRLNISLKGTEENPILIGEDEKASSSVISIGFTTGDCRYCFESEDALGSNPIIKVGCQCKGDNSNGHEICLVKWFKDKLLTSLNLECELCKGCLGAHLKSILLAKHLPEDTKASFYRSVPEVLVFVHIPIEDLDQLQVPINTPAFDKLPLHTKLAIEESFQAQKEKFQDRKMKRIYDERKMKEIYNPSTVDLVSSLAQVAQLEREYIDMVYVAKKQEDDDDDLVTAYFPRGGGVGDDMNLKIILHGIELQGEIFRVPIPSSTQDMVLEELLEALTWHVDFIVWDDDECLYILPRCMIVNNVSTLADPLASHRQFTYGRYQLVKLFSLPISTSS